MISLNINPATTTGNVPAAMLQANLEFGVSNTQAWEVGLTCGGKIKVLLEKFSETDLEIIKKINNVFDAEEKLIVLTRSYVKYQLNLILWI